MIRSILAYGLAVLLGGSFAFVFSRRLTRRIRGIEAFSRQLLTGGGSPFASGRAELGALERHLVDLGREMHAQLATVEAERAKLEMVLRSMADGVVVLDRASRVVLCNKSSFDQLELPSSTEAVGARLSFLCRNPDLTALAEDLLTPPVRSLQREIVLTFAGRRRVLSVSGAPLGDEAEPDGAILVLRDVTRVRQLEAMRADFVANVSHELRTPLTAIRGYAETLQSGAIEDPDRARQFVQVIAKHSQRLTRLIDDLLTLSDLELGRTEIRPGPLSVGEVVGGVLEVLRPKGTERRIDLRAEIPQDLPELFADRDRVEQALINLVDNAIKYSNPGGQVRVEARPAASEPAGPRIELAVVDDGIGIPARDIPRLTERFYRVDRARSRELGGTGLGLAIVKHIVQAHGGSLSIESEVERGTTVRVVLPAVRDHGAGG